MNLPEAGGTLELAAAAAHYFNATLWITAGAALLISTAAFVVMRLYLRTVFRESQRGKAVPQASPTVEDAAQPPQASVTGHLEIQTEKPGGPARPPPPQSTTFRHARVSFRHAACVYALGGSVSTATSVALLFLFGHFSIPTTPSRLIVAASYAAVFWCWSLPTVIALSLFCGPDRRLRGILLLGYVGVLPVMSVLMEFAGAPSLPIADLGLIAKDQADLLVSLAGAVTGQPVTAETVTFSPHSQPILFYSLGAFPMLVPALVFNRFIRGTVGPLFITLALLMVLSTFMIIDLTLSISPGRWLVNSIREIVGGVTPTLVVLWAISCIVSAIVAWFLLLWVGRRYRRGQLSDQTFLFDALWLTVSLWVSVYLNKSDCPFCYLLGLLPFLLYKITVGCGLKGLMTRAESLPKVCLLFLRVFGSSSRSERLFDLLAARWRYAGRIDLISATDVARGRFAPDEFLDFISGRFGSNYISTATDIERHLSGLGLGPRPDGLYRINEFFCRSDTWQQTVSRLMAGCDLVAMDLRGFTSEKRGCIFELGALIDEVSMQRVVLLIDRTTDQQFLRQALTDLWERMNPQSPNASGRIGRVRIIDLRCGYPAAVRRLMQLGDEIAASTSPAD